jgi:hypothetical protein
MTLDSSSFCGCGTSTLFVVSSRILLDRCYSRSALKLDKEGQCIQIPFPTVALGRSGQVYLHGRVGKGNGRVRAGLRLGREFELTEEEIRTQIIEIL